MVKKITINLNAALILICMLLTFSCSKSKKDNVNPASAQSNEKELLSFNFNTLSPVVTGTISGNTVTLTVPYGTNITALKPQVNVSDKASVTPAAGTAQNFSKDVNYTVTAENGTNKVYVVKVKVTDFEPVVIDNGTTETPEVLEDLGPGVDYIVKRAVVLNGNKILTINAGTTIRFDGVEAGIIVIDNAGLIMKGTANKPIVLEGVKNEPGTWLGVQVNSRNASANKWEYVTIKDAGAGLYSAGLLLDDENNQAMQIGLTHCTFSNNKGYGVWGYDNGYAYSRSIFSSFKENTFTNNTGAALSVKAGEIGSLDAASSYKNNAGKFIEVTGDNLKNNITVIPLEVPYRISAFISLQQKMTIKPGVIFEFIRDAGLYIHYQSSAGSIIAEGTASKKIQFTGAEKGRGYWYGIEKDNNDPETIFNYCVLDGAGSQPSGSFCAQGKKAALHFGGSCGTGAEYGRGIVKNCTITNSGGYGIVGRNGRLGTADNTFSGNVLADIFRY